MSSRSSLSPVSGRAAAPPILTRDQSASPAGLPQAKSQGSAFFSPGSTRVVHESPLPLSNLDLRKSDAESLPRNAPPNALAHEQAQAHSAPGEVGPPRSKVAPQGLKHSLDQQLLRRAPSSPPPLASSSGSDFELDPTAPIRAMRSQSSSHSSDIQELSGGSRRSSLLLAVLVEEEERGGDVEAPGEGEEQDQSWGESFRVEWLCTEKLPFSRTRHLLNPWNHDREVKVSRDGTELEPAVGRRLVQEWTRLSVGQPAAVPDKTAVGVLRRGAKHSPSAGMETPKKNVGAAGTGGERGAE